MNDPDVYRPHVDTIFRVAHPSGEVPLRLAAVADERSAGRVQQFSLLFHGPSDRILPQGTYPLQHEALGTIDLFIVPIVGSNHERIVYQACFNLFS